jgi:hypothetical protein
MTLDDKGGFRAVFSFSWQQGENRSHRHAPAVAASAFGVAGYAWVVGRCGGRLGGYAGFPSQRRLAVMVYHVVPIPTAALVKCVEFLKCVRFRHDGYDLAVLIDAIQSIGFGGLAINFQRSSPACIDNIA